MNLTPSLREMQKRFEIKKKNVQNFDYAKRCYWFQDKLKMLRRGESLVEKEKERNSRKGLGLEYLADLVLSIQYTS